jgi:hypothetical protein
MRLALVAVFVFTSTQLFAQLGHAPTGYYPPDFGGDMFTGVVTNTQVNELTLTYDNAKKRQTFIGRFAAKCYLPAKGGSTQAMTAENLPAGTKMSAMFRSRTTKVGLQKVKENEIIAVSFDSVGGKELKRNNDIVWVCLPAGTTLVFKAY